MPWHTSPNDAPLINNLSILPHAMTPTKETIKAAAINCLKNIYDPEIPVNIYDLGLIYNIDVDDELNVNVLMTMTAPDCPEAEYMFMQVKQMIGYIQGIKSVNVELTFNPPWDWNNLSDEVKIELGLI